MKYTETEQAIIDEVKALVESNKKGLATSDDVTKAIDAKMKEQKDLTDALKAEVAELKAAAVAQGEEFTKMRETGKKEAAKTLAHVLKAQIEERKQEWKDFVDHKSNNFSFDLKVAAGMLVSTNITGTGVPVPQVEPGLVDIASVKPSIISLCNNGRATSPTIQFTEKKNRDGNAAIVNDSTIAPLIDFDIEVNTSTVKDITASIKIHLNMINDIDFMASEISKELVYQVDILADNSVLTYLTGTAAGAFATTGIAIVSPNNFDAIMAAATQVESLNYTPNVAVLNPIDYANLIGAKSDEGVYVMPPFSTGIGTTIVGLTIVKSNQVTAGNVLVGDFNRIKVRELESTTVSTGWEEDDFRKRLVTLLGVRRLHYYVADNDTAAFVYDALADIIDAIKTT